MNQVLLTLTLSHFHLIITGWKLVGLAGALCFTARWFVQAASRLKTGSSAVPSSFWWISLVGAGSTLCYFVFGKNDSVGIIQNLFPTTIAIYNLWLDRTHARSTTTTA